MKKFLYTLLFLSLIMNFSYCETYTIQPSVYSNVNYPQKPSKVKNQKTAKTTKKTGETMVSDYGFQPLFSSWATIKAYNEINLVGERLLESSGINETVVFYVSTKRDKNASTNIHNEVKVSQGALKFVETEDELAAVLAHEIGHVINHDVWKSYGWQLVNDTLGGNSKKKKSTLHEGLSIGTGVLESKLSKTDEYKADIACIDMLVNADYNPLAAISILNKLADSHYGRSTTHPQTANRLKSMYKYIQTNYPQYIKDGYPTVSYRMALKIIKSANNF